jgi:hypothetical protein
MIYRPEVDPLPLLITAACGAVGPLHFSGEVFEQFGQKEELVSESFQRVVQEAIDWLSWAEVTALSQASVEAIVEK